jgi:eukaryotic-like serine/threonine-protein kinase
MTQTPAARLADALADRYRILRELGEGGMATVLQASDLKHDRLVAIKVMRPELAAALGAERFLREIRIAAQLVHPHILGLLDSGRVGEGPDALLYYVMPFVDGETLRARLARDGALPPRDALRILREMADALAKAHRAGIVHRDLKPDNIFLADGHALLADFGIARAVSAGRDTAAPGGPGATLATALGTSIGTPAYMAPEQAAADPAIDHRADLYSLGVVAYEMLGGRPPFEAASTHQLIVAHLTEQPAPLTARRPGLDPALAAIVMRCLQKSPDARFPDADALAAALDTVHLGATGPSTVPMDAIAPARPSRRPLLIGGAVALAALAGVVALRSHRPQAAEPSTATAPPAADARSLAVLPFANLTGDSANQYFSDGISEEILDAVARIPGLRVAARTSAFALRGTTLDARAIGQRLGVRHVLDGSVERAPGRVRVRARLADAETGVQLWSDKYDRDARDVFALQDEISTSIAGALTTQLGAVAVPRALGGSQDPEAVDAYLRGREALRRRTGGEGLRQAEQFFLTATRRDPGFARAWAGLASARVVLPEWDGGARAKDAETGASEAVARALALDSTSAEAHAALGYLRKSYRYDWAGAEAAYRRALALSPSDATAHQWLGELLAAVGRPADATAELQRAGALDPESAVVLLALGSQFHAVGDTAAGRAAFARGLAIQPDFWAILLWQLWQSMQGGDTAAALVAADRFATATGSPSAPYHLLVRARGDARLRPEALDTVSAWHRAGQQPFVVANWYAAIGERERALAVLGEIVRDRRAYATYTPWWPFFADLRALPAWRSILDALRLPPTAT